MNIKKLGIGAASFAVVGVLGLGAASFANADDTPTPTSTSKATATAGEPSKQGKQGPPGNGGGRGHGAGRGHVDATADEAGKATAAVTAKDSAVTVVKVMKADDGSFDVKGTKAGAPIAFRVSADYAVVTQKGPGDGRCGKGVPRRHNHPDASAEETAKVTAAVTAKDPAITVIRVMKDDDGSFDVKGTKAGARVHVEVSADLATVDIRTGGPGVGKGMGDGNKGDGNKGDGKGASTAPTTTTTPTT